MGILWIQSGSTEWCVLKVASDVLVWRHILGFFSSAQLCKAQTQVLTAI